MRTLRTAALLTVAGSTFWAMGCVSVDRHVYQTPYTRDGALAIVAVDTQEELWRQAIPPGQKLVVDLDRKGAHESWAAAQGVPATEIEWSLFPGDKKMLLPGFSVGEPLASGQELLPGTPVLLVYSLSAPITAPAPIEEDATDAAPMDAGAQPDEEAAQGTMEPTEGDEPTAPEETGVEAEAETEAGATRPAEPADAVEPEPVKGDAPAAPAEEEPVFIK